MAKQVVRGKQGGREIRVDKRKERGDGPSQVVKRNERKRRDSHIRKNNKKQVTSRQELRKKEKDKLPGITNWRSSGENILN